MNLIIHQLSRINLKIKLKLFIMIDTNSPEFELEKKIGHLLVTYIGVRLIIKGTKFVIKSGRVLITSPRPTP